MNCEQGDLAVLVRSFAGQEGKITRCVEFVGEVRFDSGRTYTDCWRIDPPFYVLPTGIKANYASDSCLKPIRGQDGADETLAWSGKPQEVTA